MPRFPFLIAGLCVLSEKTSESPTEMCDIASPKPVAPAHRGSLSTRDCHLSTIDKNKTKQMKQGQGGCAPHTCSRWKNKQMGPGLEFGSSNIKLRSSCTVSQIHRWKELRTLMPHPYKSGSRLSPRFYIMVFIQPYSLARVSTGKTILQRGMYVRENHLVQPKGE